MKTLENVPKIEAKKAPENIVDREFEDAETKFSFEDGMNIARDLFDEVYDLNSNLRKTASENGMLQYMERKVENGIRHYYLPDIPGGEKGDLNEIREGYDSRVKYFKAGERIFIQVGQGEMWVVPKAANPYFKITASECSVLVGENKDKIIIAHLSYSALNELAEAVKFMRENDIALENISAVASVGNNQKERSAEEFKKRATEVGDYIKEGIDPKHVVPFSYERGEEIGMYERILRNMAGVLVNKMGMFKWNFDLRQDCRRSGLYPVEKRVGDYKDEVFCQFNNRN